nr:uncharacterized protein LOC111426478 isoform X1 [Onthophagus taurus]
MGDRKCSTTEKDVERQLDEVSLKISESHMSLGKEKPKRIPSLNGSEILVYLVLAAMFVLGWYSLNSCSISRMIPIYLIVGGAVGLLIKALLATTNVYLFNIMVSTIAFYVVWHVTGSYYVFKEYQPNYDPTIGPYCDRIPYLLAFWVLIIQYALFGLFLVLTSCEYLMKKEIKT